MKGNFKYLLIYGAIALSINSVKAQYIDNYFTSLTRFRWDSQLIKLRHAKDVMQDNEFERNLLVSNIYANPLLINGKMLDYGTFDGTSRGVLTVVKGKPETSEAQAIPFYVYIRRNGKILSHSKMHFSNKKLLKIEISEVLQFCKINDVLIIKPANAEDWMAKRILKIINDFGC